jgi:2-hydroxy-6-oxonona-2,4-dienedioate hydrolase/4,5:9,10-diseco-3-hydroxy-5,9,17-trioxoandrosta-1(10),2-diene-4-oate hydrolase
MGRIVLGLMDALKIDAADLVGNSLGGAAALMAALSAPNRVRRLVLMGPGGGLPVFTPFPTLPLLKLINFYDGSPPTAERLRAALEQLVFDPTSVTDELVAERLANCLRPDVMSHPPIRGRIPEDIWREPIGKLQQPTLLIWGRDDRVIPLDSSLILLRLIPNARLHVLPRGHWAQWECADEFNVLVEQFLSRTN